MNYLQKNRKYRKKVFINTKNQIKENLFFTHDMLSENTQWADIYFIGKNKIVYNATIYTTYCAWHDEVSSQAWEKLRANKHPDEELFEIIELEGDTYNGISKPTTISNPPRASLGGKTASEFLKESEQEIAKNEKIKVHEAFKIIPSYTYGIGLDMIIHVPHLNETNINDAIKQFIALGETNWTSKEDYGFTYIDNPNFTINSLKMD